MEKTKCGYCNKDLTNENPYCEYWRCCLSCIEKCIICDTKCIDNGDYCDKCGDFYCDNCKKINNIITLNFSCCNDEKIICNKCIGKKEYHCKCYKTKKILRQHLTECIICKSKENLTDYKCSNEECIYKNEEFNMFCNKCVIICDKCDEIYCKNCNSKTISCFDCGKDYCKDCWDDDVCECYKECGICDERTHYEDMEKCNVCNLNLCGCCRRNSHKCKKTNVSKM